MSVEVTLPALSLFSSSGIGNLGLRAAGVNFIVANELLEDRAALLSLNFPETEVVAGDVLTKFDEIVAKTRARLRQMKAEELFLLVATPPCQGMSPNGLGTLLNNVRKGMRPKLDPRNRLILPALQAARELRPRWIIFENVVPMKNTVIEVGPGEFVKVVDLIRSHLGEEYVGRYYEVEFADYGLPQRRQRLITVYTRDQAAIENYRANVELIPEPTHAASATPGRKPWVTLREALADMPPLDGRSAASAVSTDVPLHRVPVLDPKKYEWIRHTPEARSAFDNQCINPECRYQNNPVHGAARNKDGINRANQGTPLYCVRCGALLPRPYVKERNGTLRIMSGFTSAYRRMSWNLPASTLTCNLNYPSSDYTLHPSENRVLSIAEALRLQSISNYAYQWGPVAVRGVPRAEAPDTLITDCIGESVPPLFMELLGRHVQKLASVQLAGVCDRPKQLEFSGLWDSAS